MHLYNAWLPPPVALEAKREKESFGLVVRSVRDSWRSDDPESVYASLKWISVIDLFIKAKSDISLEDVEELVVLGLKFFHASQNKLYAQVRWGNLLVKLLNKYRKRLSLDVQWRPFYDNLLKTHFSRNTGPEGWRLRQRHFETVTSLIRSCRKFFPSGSASEVWLEFRPSLGNPWHNSCFEGSGFLRLFLPTNSVNEDFFSHNWINQCIDIWNSIPKCQFWDSQWAAIIARCIKSYALFDWWEHFLPLLYTRFLNMFEVPVSSGNGSYPFCVDVPRNTRFLFSNKAVVPSKAVAKSIVYLLKPGSLAQEYLEKLVDLLEQYYHPSNGGRWTYALERFLRYLVITFQKRLQQEQLNANGNGSEKIFLRKSEIVSFVKVVLKLIDRGQYSKNDSLAETVAAATSILSYVEPLVVLPFIASRFHMALETMTATHQLTTAVTSVAFAGRALFLASFSSSFRTADAGSSDAFGNLLMISLSNALLGLDANDPPKTLATMQLIGSIFSNIASLDDNNNVLPFLPSISFSEWLDEFLCRLFTLFQNLEPNSIINEGTPPSSTSGTFLVEDGHFFFCMLEILLGKLSKPLFSQALKKISKFVQTNVLPGAIAEVGLLCCACVHSCPEEAAVHLIQPILFSILSSLQGSPVTGFGGTGITNDLLSNKAKLALSPALEIAVDYQLKILSLAISYAGPVLLCCKDLLKEAITAAFNAPSWKVNVGGDHVLRSLFGSLVLYYPIDQYKCHSDGTLLEEWISAKAYQSEQMTSPLWHLPSEDEVSFANELLNLHFCSALDDLLLICQTKIHSEPGIEKEHLKVTLLRIESTLQGVQSCLPDFHASFGNGVFNDLGSSSFLIAGAIGSTVGSSELRAKAVEIIHVACKYLLEERPDDSILLILVIRIMDALGNYGSLEYDEWSNHRQAWKLESAAIIEPPINFIVASHSQGKKRPRWALIDKVCMHNTWRSSQSSYHLFRTSTGLSPSDHVCLLMDDLLRLSLCNYETVRIVAGKSLLKILKRWSSMISKCVLTLTEKLQNSNSHEHEVLGSCALLSTQMVIKHLTVDRKSFSSFLLGVLASYHHESLKSQKAINELFVKFNIHFTGVSRSILKKSQNRSDESEFTDLVVEIGSMSVDTTGLHWRYNLMANRILLLLTMASMSDPDSSSDILSTTAAHFLKNLRSQLPQTRMLSVSALNTLLKESPHKIFDRELHPISEDFKGNEKSSLEGALSQIFCEEGFFSDTMNSLSHVHIITDIESTSSRGTHGASSFQSLADKSITHFYFDFSASWPRTPSWISILGNDTFYAHFARIFKRLVQECGMPILLAFQCSLEQFSNAKERSKQCVAAEALAGVLHSDVTGLVEAWDSWIKVLLQKVILAPSVDSIPEWAASIRYAVTGKGKYGTRAPILRQRILDCLVAPLPQVVATNVVAKRYTFLSAALIEVSPNRMQRQEVELHEELLEELMSNMIHSSAQVREVIGVALSVLCSNIRLRESFIQSICDKGETKADDLTGRQNWGQDLTQRASELAVNIQNTLQSGHSEFQGNKTYIREHSNNESQDVKWMETMFHFIISSLKSGRSSALLDIMVGLLYPAISLQETSNKDLSALAKASFELLKWRIFPVPHLQQAVSVLLSSSNDCNWRTRYATLTYLRTFLYRHTFIMSRMEKQQIWETIEKLLKDNQVEVREHAAAVLAALMKGGDEDLARDFRDRAIKEATSIQKRRRKRNSSTGDSVPSVHGTVLALAASVLSVPYDMPSWLPDQVTLLARFIHEPSPVRSTVMKAVAEFRRTHADTWSVQKDSFSEEQLEVLADTSSSASYFA